MSCKSVRWWIVFFTGQIIETSGAVVRANSIAHLVQDRPSRNTTRSRVRRNRTAISVDARGNLVNEYVEEDCDKTPPPFALARPRKVTLEHRTGYRARIHGAGKDRRNSAMKVLKQMNASWVDLLHKSNASVRKLRNSFRFEANSNSTVVVPLEAMAEFNKAPMLTNLAGRMPDMRKAHTLDGGPVDHTQLYATVNFPLSGPGLVQIINEDARDIFRLKRSHFHQNRFIRVRVSIPTAVLPQYGSNIETVIQEDGVRMSPSIPVSTEHYWNEKSDGYMKYGPTFIKRLESSEVSATDKAIVPITNNKNKPNVTIVLPMDDKTKPVTTTAERVLVRGKLVLENMQRYRLTFPKQMARTSLRFESMEGWLEDIASSQQWLNLTMLMLHTEDRRNTSWPLDKKHSSPATKKGKLHVHQSYGSNLQVQPVSGHDLLSIAGSRKYFIFGSGAQLETNFIVAWEIAAAAVAAVGADAIVDVAAGAAVDAGADAVADAAAGAAVDAATDAAVDAGADAAVDAGADAVVDAGADAGADEAFDGGADAVADAAEGLGEETDAAEGFDETADAVDEDADAEEDDAVDDAEDGKNDGGKADECPDKIKDIAKDVLKDYLNDKLCLDENPCQDSKDDQLEACVSYYVPFFVMQEGKPYFLKSGCSCKAIPGYNWEVVTKSSSEWSTFLKDGCKSADKQQDAHEYIEKIKNLKTFVGCASAIPSLFR